MTKDLRTYLSFDNSGEDCLHVVQVFPLKAGGYATVEQHQFVSSPPIILHKDVAGVKVTMDKVVDKHLQNDGILEFVLSQRSLGSLIPVTKSKMLDRNCFLYFWKQWDKVGILLPNNLVPYPWNNEFPFSKPHLLLAVRNIHTEGMAFYED